MSYRLQLLGGAAIESDAGPMVGAVAQRRRLAFLALLAASPTGAMSRERVATFLFPEADSARAHKGLADALHAVRKALGKDAVLAVGDELRLDPEVVCSDVAEMRDALAAGDAERAVALYRGPFLDGFAVPGALELERWIDAERERIAREFGRGLQAAAESSEAAGDSTGAVDWWNRLAAHDPYSSEVTVRLMRALAASGNVAAALRHAAVHAALLHEQLDAIPSAEVTALAERLRRDGHAGEPPPNARDAAGQGVTERDAAIRANAVPRMSVSPDARFRPRGLQAWRRAAMIGAPLVLAALGVVKLARGYVATWGVVEHPSASAADARSPRDRVIIADFEEKGGAGDLASVVTDLVRIDLRQSTVVRVVESGEVRQVLARMGVPRAPLTPEAARELAIRDGIKAVVTGTLSRAGPGYLLTARVTAVQSGKEIVGLRETAADSTKLIAAIERLSRRLRAEIGEPVRAVRASAPLAAVTTPSLDALRKFSQADRAAFVEGDQARAIQLLEEAIALDTAFACAHTLLFSVLHMRGIVGGQAEMMRRVDALTASYRHRDRLTERERYVIEAVYLSQLKGEPDQAISAMRAAVDAYPDDPLLVGSLGNYYANVGDFARAESLMLRATEMDPSGPSMGGLNNVAAIQTYRAKYDEAEATWRRLAASYPDQHLVIIHGMSLTAIARGDYDRAEKWLREHRAAWPNDHPLQAATAKRLALLATMRGQLAEAERYRAEVRGATAPAAPAMSLEGSIALAQQDALLRGSASRAAQRLDAALARTPLDSIPLLDRPYLEIASVYAQAARFDRAKSLLMASRRAVPPELRPSRDAAAWVRLEDLTAGIIALSEGRLQQAIADLHRADLGEGVSAAMLPPLGLAFERSGQPDSAIATYERYLLPRVRVSISLDAVWLATVHRRLAELYDHRGDADNATSHYSRFIALWKGADTELQPQVAVAVRRVAELTGTQSGSQD